MFSHLYEKFLEIEMSIVEEANEKEEEKILLWKMMKGICCILMSYLVFCILFYIFFRKKCENQYEELCWNEKEIPSDYFCWLISHLLNVEIFSVCLKVSQELIYDASCRGRCQIVKFVSKKIFRCVKNQREGYRKFMGPNEDVVC
jgi:hypothetical protein